MIYPIYNEWKNEPDIELFFGEEICPQCKGSGVRQPDPCKIASIGFMFMCRLCHGNGKVDWISRIMKGTK